MEFQSVADNYARKYGVDPDLFRALVKQESGWNPKAVSPRGAQGLAQVMPDTARQPGFGVTPLQDALNPEENLRFGAEYFSKMMHRYEGDVNKALAAYNWGAGNADKWDGDLNSLPEETRNYINTITGNLRQQQQAPITVQTLDGQTPTDQLTRMAERAILASNESEIENVLTPVGMPPQQPQAQVPPEAVTQAAREDQGMFGGLFQGGENPGFFANDDNAGFVKMIGWDKYSQNQRDDRWLAIGAGLLSGDDWASGMGAAAQNVLGLRQQEEQNDLRRQQIAGNQAGYDAKFQKVGSVLNQDTGDIVGGVSYDPNTGEYFTLGDGGKRNVISNPLPLNNSDASGSRFVSPAQVAKLRENVQTGHSTLRALDRMEEALASYTPGAPGLITDLSRRAKTFLGSTDLTEEEIQRVMAQGEIQGLIGKVREDVVGPGVMTEQDALRVLAFIGGGLGAFDGSNPAVVQERITKMREGIYRAYGQNFDQYQKFTEVPGSVYLPMERYQPPAPKQDTGALDSSNAAPQPSEEVDDILKGYGI